MYSYPIPSMRCIPTSKQQKRILGMTSSNKSQCLNA